MRFKKKPVEIEAYQFPNYPTGWISCKHRYMVEGSCAYMIIYTLEGEMRVDDGDWIIKGVKGEFYPCNDDIFKMTYEEVL